MTEEHAAHPPPDRLYAVWTNIPGCTRVAAELWVGRNFTGTTLFVSDADDTISAEVPLPGTRTTHVVSLADLERVIAQAKGELQAMGGRSAP